MDKEIEYLKEHLYEIYKYKKSMKDLTYDMDIEHLLRTCKALDYSQKENKRLNNKLKGIKSQLDYIETYSNKEDVFEDMKRRLDRIENIIGSE